MQNRTISPENVIVFGGSFNPPTRAHEQIIRACLEQPGFDEVWVMPSGDRSDKRMSSTDAARIAMLETMKLKDFAGEQRLQITDFELQLPRPTQTIRTVGALAVAYPETRFWHVYGADSYESMPQWEGGKDLQASLPVLLLPRADTPLPAESDTIRHLPDVMGETAEISSTQVREAAAQRADITEFVSRSVATFIAQHRLYIEPQAV